MRTLFVVLLFSALTLRAGNDPAARLYRQPTAKEIERVIASIKKDERKPDSMAVITAGLKEPNKSAVLDDPSTAVREVSVMVRDMRTRRLHLVSGNAETGAITEWMRVDGELHALNADDVAAAEQIVRKHKGWMASLRRRNIDSSTVVVTIWPSGIPKTSFKTRIVRAIAWITTKGVNRFDRPIEGLVCTVNLDQNRVIEFHDREMGPVPPPASWPMAQKPQRTTPSAAIKVNGNTITWKQWTFDATLREREGLVLSRLRWTEGNVQRSVAHSIGLSEIVSVCADTSVYWYWRNAFIVGEFGLGRTVAPLIVGADVPSNTRTFSAAVIGANGIVRTVNDAFGIYEHHNTLTITQQSRIGGLVYRLSYQITSTGAITVDVGVGGTPMVKTTSAKESATANVVAPGLVAPFMYHAANVRCDLDVDGVKNSVSEVEYVLPPDGANTYHQSVNIDDYELRFEKEALRGEAADVYRRWKVSSPSNTSYTLIPGSTVVPTVRESNMMLQRAPFLSTPFVCTRYDAKQRYASGDYAMQSSGDEDLTEYVADNASIFRKDIVVWYTMSMFTAPRREDWPVMDLQHMSFTLVPDGFVRSPKP